MSENLCIAVIAPEPAERAALADAVRAAQPDARVIELNPAERRLPQDVPAIDVLLLHSPRQAHRDQLQLVRSLSEDELFGGAPLIVTGNARKADSMIEAGAREHIADGDFNERTLQRAIRDVRAQPGPDVHLARDERLAGVRGPNDDLTGLPDRRAFHRRLARQINSSRRDGRLFGVLYIDLNRFKSINAQFGHAIGDRVLATVAGRLERARQPGDLAFRLGDDEFAILLTDLSTQAEAQLNIQRFERVIAQDLPVDSHHFNCTASIGLAVYPYDGRTADQILTAAEEAMHHIQQRERQSDRGRRQQIRDLQPARPGADPAKLRLPDRRNRPARREAMIRDLSEREDPLSTAHFQYQPIVDRNLAMAGGEALFRWDNPAFARIGPEELFETLGGTPFGMRLTLRCLDEMFTRMAQHCGACRQPCTRPQPDLSVNMSGPQFDWKLFGKRIHRLPLALRQRLIVEITERTAVDDIDRATWTALELRRHGIRVAIDDFGTGFSNLEILTRLEPDILKVDRSLISKASSPGGQRARSVLEWIVDLAGHFDATTVAEGVETRAQAEICLAAGFDRLQGYYFGRAMPWNEFCAFAMQHRADGSQSAAG